ncbi:MAG: hypothetical protein ACRDRW_19050 [Pseudonocardiaceae bacterium]
MSDGSTLAYGPAADPTSLLLALREQRELVDTLAPPTEGLLITAGASSALDLICTHEARAGQHHDVRDTSGWYTDMHGPEPTNFYLFNS